MASSSESTEPNKMARVGLKLFSLALIISCSKSWIMLTSKDTDSILRINKLRSVTEKNVNKNGGDINSWEMKIFNLIP